MGAASFFSSTKMSAVLLAIVTFSACASPSVETQQKEVKLTAASEFSLTSFSGEELSLGKFAGKVVILNFWSSTCTSCRIEAPELEKVWKEYRNKDAVIVGINVGDGESDAKRFIGEFGVTYPNAPDREGIMLFKYAVRVIPTSVFITRSGEIAHFYEGPLTQKQLVSLIEHTREMK